MIEKDDLEKFKKLKINNILELSLIIPISYEDNHIYSDIKPYEQVFEVEPINVNESPKVLKATLFAKNIDMRIEAIFFNVKPYHRSIFKSKSKLYLRGRLENKFNSLQLTQPKVVSSIEQITPIYKTPLKTVTLKALIKKYINLLNLNQFLPSKASEIIYNLHFPKEYKPELSKSDIYTLKFIEILNHLQKLISKKRIYSSNMKISKNPEPFINSLEFELTNDQKKAIYDIAKDINSDIQTRRVVIGDVGSGKTLVMLSTAFMADKNKSIIMCPTSILANQIYSEAQKFLKLNILLVTQKSKFKDEDIQNADLIIGTHAILYQDLPEVAIVMVDEQHRFGSMQREMLSQLTKKNKKLPHFIQFSATPIPRTQALMMSNFVNVSLIKELPFPKKIDTEVIHKDDFKNLITHINEEISNNNQVVIVYPLVEESSKFNYQSLEEGKDFWMKNFEKVYLTHGKDKNKDETLEEFKNCGNILLTTTVIEVGISLPRLTTIVIVGAERMGFASLHQLRGRVARYGQQGFCFLYTNEQKSKRLDEFASTLDGFKIAELDLRFRKSGDLLDGKVQSGKSFRFFDESTDEAILVKAKEFIK
jgi:ATP-dependent DNA helicase RecG